MYKTFETLKWKYLKQDINLYLYINLYWQTFINYDITSYLKIIKKRWIKETHALRILYALCIPVRRKRLKNVFNLSFEALLDIVWKWFESLKFEEPFFISHLHILIPFKNILCRSNALELYFIVNLTLSVILVLLHFISLFCAHPFFLIISILEMN